MQLKTDHVAIHVAIHSLTRVAIHWKCGTCQAPEEWIATDYGWPMADEKKDRHTHRVVISLPAPFWARLGKLVGNRNRSGVVRALVAWYLREPGAKLPERPPRAE